MQGPLPTTGAGQVRFNTIADIVNASLQIIFPLAGILVFLYLVWAGFDMVTSLGNADKIKKSTAKITNAIIGLVLLALSYWLAKIAVQMFWG